MSSKGKYIGISNRIPFVVLEYAIADFISTGQVNTPSYLKYILEFTKGENRAKKTLSHLVSIINKNTSLINLLAKQTKGDFQTLSLSDRRAFLICLYSLTFPIVYDILNAFSIGFKVQEKINKRVIIEKIGAIYGSNRAMHIGIDETIPLFLDCGIISRPKRGMYVKGQILKTTNQLISELIIYVNIKLSSSNSILVEDINYKPWYSYFEPFNISNDKFNFLLNRKEGAIGKGYISIKSW
jgi:hypothetical protein